MVKRVDYEKRRVEILQQAVRLFLEQGYENSSIADIAKGCGMRLSRLYQYFHNKEEILEYLIEHLAGELGKRLERVLKGQSNPLEKLKGVIGTLGKELAQEENRLVILLELQRLVECKQNELLAKIDTYSRDLRQLFYQLLQEGEEQGLVKVNESENMAFALAVLMESLVFQIVLNRKFAVEEHLDQLFHFLDDLQIST